MHYRRVASLKTAEALRSYSAEPAETCWFALDMRSFTLYIEQELLFAAIVGLLAFVYRA